MTAIARKICCYASIAIATLVGCAGIPIVPVSDLTTPRGHLSAKIVRPGDTLYMIAWEAGLDYRQLADWNALKPPYRLKLGRRIRLTAPNLGDPSNDGNIQANSTAVSNWHWPATGPVIESFTGQSGNNGIDISGRKGGPVRAAADGVVVYAGSGLRGYGQLLILQHNEVLLSAYAHNQALLVKEGSLVKGGETIAKMGDTDAESPRLHFEIRRDGKPVNPLDYLPARSS